jgi:putative intracellular protease/amidase
VLGGAQSALADADYPYLPALARLTRAFGDSGRAVLGICGGVEVLDIQRLEGEDSRLTVRYRLDGRTAETVATGTTVVEAHAHLREQLVIDRVRLGFAILAGRSAESRT